MSKSQKTKKRVVLLDSHAIIHRAYHALPGFTNSQGEPTGALYGLTTMLLKIITDLKPDYIIACFDLPKKTNDFYLKNMEICIFLRNSKNIFN